MECRELQFQNELDSLFRGSTVIDFIRSKNHHHHHHHHHRHHHSNAVSDRCDSSESSDSGITTLSAGSDALDLCSPYSSPRTVQSPETESSSGYESSAPNESSSTNSSSSGSIPESWPCGGTAGYLYHLQKVQGNNTLEDNDCDAFFPQFSFDPFEPDYKNASATSFVPLYPKDFSHCKDPCCLPSLPMYCVQPGRADDLRCSPHAAEPGLCFRCGARYECACGSIPNLPSFLPPRKSQCKPEKNGSSQHKVQEKITKYFKIEKKEGGGCLLPHSGNCVPRLSPAPGGGQQLAVTLIERKRRRSGIVLDGEPDVPPCSDLHAAEVPSAISSSISVTVPPLPCAVDSKVVVQCQWQGCGTTTADGTILEHLHSKHVQPQVVSDSFRCLWQGCKVYGKASCSLSWLSRHVIVHGGPKPFPCIVAGCLQRFPSHSALERHVNTHFSQAAAPAAKRTPDVPIVKIPKRNGKVKARIRRNPCTGQCLSVASRAAHRVWIPARCQDFFDTAIMERMRHQLVESVRHASGGDLSLPDTVVTVHSSVRRRPVAVKLKKKETCFP